VVLAVAVMAVLVLLVYPQEVQLTQAAVAAGIGIKYQP